MKLTAEQITEFEEFISKVMKENNMPGLAVGIANGNEILYKKGFGVKDLGTKSPVTTKTIFGVASVTKSFTCSAVMKLCEEGKMSPHDPVKRFLPEFGVPGGSGDDVTPHHCMTHSAGFPPLPSLGWGITDNTRKDKPRADEKKSEEIGKPKSEQKDKEDVRKDKPKAHPPVTTYTQLLNYLRTGDFTMLAEAGKYHSYSNDAYGVLGAVIEQVSGEMYARYVEQNILAPLGMKRSTFNLEEILRDDDTTTLYYKKDWDEENGDEIFASNNWQIAPAHMACGWLKSCVDDLLNYVRWHATGGTFGGAHVLSKESLDLMSTPYINNSRDKKYGYGFRIQNDCHGLTMVDHTGGLKGVSSQVGWIKEKGLSAVVLCNLSGAPAHKVLTAAFNMCLGLPLDTPRSTYRKDDWSKEELENLTGTFKSGEGGFVTLASENGKLFARYGKSGKRSFEVRKDSDSFGVITIEGQDNEIEFLRNPEGGLWAIRSGGRIIRNEPASENA